jgi:lactate dehydrogenase-like 2-hydroxyacid dehydrogenase
MSVSWKKKGVVDLSGITVLVPGRLHAHAVERIEERFRLVRTERADPVLINARAARGVRAVAAFGGVTQGFIDALPNLEIIANFGVGYDGVDAVHAARRNIVVTNTPDVLTDEVADTAIALLLNTLREFPRAENWLRQGRWPTERNYPLTPLTLRGRKVGIYGMGRIGQAIAHRLDAFGVTVAYHNRRPIEGEQRAWHDSLVGLAEAVDTLICVAPGGEGTKHAVDARVLRALGASGVFVNVGRGSSVDEPALIAALADGTIAAAGLDVFEDEPSVPQALLDLPNACLLPHVASASVHTRRAMADLVVDNLVSWFESGVALTPVPETEAIAANRKAGGDHVGEPAGDNE